MSSEEIKRSEGSDELIAEVIDPNGKTAENDPLVSFAEEDKTDAVSSNFVLVCENLKKDIPRSAP